MTNGRATGRGSAEPARLSKAAETLLYHLLETEIGGVQVYETALHCAQNEDLEQEWKRYLEETREHVRIYTELCRELEIDPETNSPCRKIVRQSAQGLVHLMEMALAAKDPDAAQLVPAMLEPAP